MKTTGMLFKLAGVLVLAFGLMGSFGLWAQSTVTDSYTDTSSDLRTGTNSSATGINSTAYGQAVTASGLQSTATGAYSQATTTNSSAYGVGANASGLQSTATGAYSQATTTNSSAYGVGANASGFQSTATGAYSQAATTNSSSYGVSAIASGLNSTATGYASTASGANSTAIGANSSATAANSVALGQGSLANQVNTVSVGNAATGLTRRITNVAPGVSDTDAVNVGQLNAITQQDQSYAKTQAQSSGAVLSAALNASVAGVGQPGNNHLSAGVGVMGNQAGFGVAFQRSFNGWSASLSTSTNGSLDYTQVGGGVGISF